MLITVHKDGGKHILRDENETVYGRYDTKEEADDAAEGWNAYYADPLPEMLS